MPEYLAPGVYVEEISGGAKPIEAVGTSTACFIGFTEKAQQTKLVDGEKQYKSVVGKPIFLTSWEEYVETFGNFVPNFFTPLSVYGFFQNGGKRCYIISLREIPRATTSIISQDTKEYIRIVAKAAGKRGEDLRVQIDPRQLPIKQPKFTLKIKDDSPPVWTKVSDFQITLKEDANTSSVEIIPPATPTDLEFVAADGTSKITGASLDSIWPKIDENTQFDVPHEFLGSDGKPYLKIQHVQTNAKPSKLNVKIATDKSKSDEWKLEVTVLEDEEGKWKKVETVDFTLKKRAKTIEISLPPPDSMIDIRSSDTNDHKKIQVDDLSKVWTDNPPLTKIGFASELNEWSFSKDYLKLVTTTSVSNKLRLTVSKDPTSTATELKLQVKVEKLEQEEMLSYSMKKENEDPEKIKELILDTPHASSLVALSYQEPNKQPENPKDVSLYDAWPLPGQTVTLDDNRDSYHFRSTNGKQFLKVSRVDTKTMPKKKLEIVLNPQEFKRPTFEVKVERRNEHTGVWNEEERREVTLRRQEKKVNPKTVSAINTNSTATAQETITILKVEYPGGMEPRTIEILPMLQDNEQPIDVTEWQLDSLWPTKQEQTMPQSPQAKENKGLELAIKGNSNETVDELLGPARYDQYQGDPMERTGMGGLEDIDDINFICMPDLMKAWSDKSEDQKYVQSVQALAIAHCDRLKNRMVILDPPPDMNPQEIKNWREKEVRYDSSRAVLYYPWVELMDPATNRTTFMPPSGFVAGIWARNDINRGVHKAPANEVVQLAVGLQFEVGQGHQEILNPIGINCIRPLRGMGIRVWGARTLSQSDPEWKYVNVRRLFHMIEQSIQRSTMWAVFEPNDHRLWAKLRRDVRNFLMVLYSQGMLFGATPGQAFFVKCDEENNPKFTRDLGQVIVDIGVSPSKPAEFVIFRIRQWSPDDDQA